MGSLDHNQVETIFNLYFNFHSSKQLPLIYINFYKLFWQKKKWVAILMKQNFKLVWPYGAACPECVQSWVLEVGQSGVLSSLMSHTQLDKLHSIAQRTEGRIRWLIPVGERYA